MKIKVCGMKYGNNLKAVAKLSPEYIGFIFYRRSKRYVGTGFNEKIISGLPENIKKVGVFVDPEKDDVFRNAKKYDLDLIQLHGNESPQFCREINKKYNVIKAFGIHEGFDFTILEKYKNCCKYILFDSKTRIYGGSGKKFDWNILKNYNNEIPFFLGGGISIENINEVKKMEGMNLHAVDINSKIEVMPAFKDIDKLKIMINEIRS
jgi:phosphoribosylanthranilate isomerase